MLKVHPPKCIPFDLRKLATELTLFISCSKDGEIEYSVMSPLVSVSLAQDGRRMRKHLPTILTELEFDLKLPRPINGTWNVTCATTSRLSYLHQWDVSACKVTGDWTPSSNVTRCRCPSAGLFAVLARIVPEVSNTSLQDNRMRNMWFYYINTR